MYEPDADDYISELGHGPDDNDDFAPEQGSASMGEHAEARPAELPSRASARATEARTRVLAMPAGISARFPDATSLIMSFRDGRQVVMVRS